MRVTELSLPGLLHIEPVFFGDSRGYFLQTWQAEKYRAAGLSGSFVQDNLSLSKQGTLRGLHYQKPNTQGKLVFVLKGEVWDVAVDLRLGSPTFGKWEAVTLKGQTHNQLYVPPGLAHGFCVLSEEALFTYKCTDFYAPECEHGIIWNDPDLNIPWPVKNPILSSKDGKYPRFREIPESHLFHWETKP
jgi:dTDP-4-dehydrorhamnose 3,5-epimerase